MTQRSLSYWLTPNFSCHLIGSPYSHRPFLLVHTLLSCLLIGLPYSHRAFLLAHTKISCLLIGLPTSHIQFSYWCTSLPPLPTPPPLSPHQPPLLKKWKNFHQLFIQKCLQSHLSPPHTTNHPRRALHARLHPTSTMHRFPPPPALTHAHPASTVHGSTPPPASTRSNTRPTKSQNPLFHPT